jgi:Mce-associated membrane protein
MTSWARLNVFLAVLVVGLLGATVIVLVNDSATPAATATQRVSARYDAVTGAARAEILAFLHVDHRRMGPLTTAVLDGATGSFKSQYAANRAQLIGAARRSQARATGTVRAVGIADLGADRAVVYVAADSVLRSKGTRKQPATKACPHPGAGCRSYRFKLTMQRTSAGWKLAELGFVS